ncbi:MAG: SDR family NAD(P)-dependent oxidoreductase [Leifsonia sp.]
MTATGKLVLIAGATSASGRAVAAALLDAGARVVSVGSDAGRLADVSSALPGLVTELCDLTEEESVAALAERVHAQLGPIDGLVHLVGGWRGGGGLAGQTDADYRVLERSLTALRHVTRAFNDDLLASPAGRLAIVSATAVERPTPGNANYVAVKSAAEAWTRAVGHGFASRQADAPTRSAAVVYRVKALAGLEDQLAASVVGLWDADASALNGSVIPLS